MLTRPKPGDLGGGQDLLRDEEGWNSETKARLPAFRNLEIRKGDGIDLERQFCGFLHELKGARVNIKWTI